MAVLAFNLVGFVLLYALSRAQGMVPMNPDGIGGIALDLARSTAVSFGTNTNGQTYSGGAQLSLLSQMASHVATTLRCEVVLLRPSPDGDLQVVGGFPPEDRLDARDQPAPPLCSQPARHRAAGPRCAEAAGDRRGHRQRLRHPA